MVYPDTDADVNILPEQFLTKFGISSSTGRHCHHGHNGKCESTEEFFSISQTLHQQVAFGLQGQVEQELQVMVDKGILEKLEMRH